MLLTQCPVRPRNCRHGFLPGVVANNERGHQQLARTVPKTVHGDLDAAQRIPGLLGDIFAHSVAHPVRPRQRPQFLQL